MLNTISKYKIKNIKKFKYLKTKELFYNFKKSIKNDNILYTFLIRNYFTLFFFNQIKKKFISLNFKTNLRLRCLNSTNSHSILNKFGLNRIILRKFISFGYINGYFKASW